MTDQTIGLPGLPAKQGRLRALAARLWRPGELRPATAWILIVLLAAVVGRHFWRDEGEFANILFAVAVTAALVAFVMLIAQRALFATAVVASLVAVIVWAASAKRAPPPARTVGRASTTTRRNMNARCTHPVPYLPVVRQLGSIAPINQLARRLWRSLDTPGEGAGRAGKPPRKPFRAIFIAGSSAL